MEKRLSLEADIRERTGSRHSSAVRSQGRIPAVIYGHKKDVVSISVNAHDFVEGIHHGHRLMDIKMGDKTEQIMVKEIQYDYLGRDVIHADLVRVDMSETVKVVVSIELKGIAEGTHHGGIVEEHADRLEIECKVSDIPEHIVVWVKDVNVGDSVHARDIELPAGIKLISPADTMLVTCHLVAAAKTTEELEEEAPGTPEVIGEAERTEKTEGEEAAG